MRRELICEGLGFAEGLRWRNGALWISDMASHRVVRIDVDSGERSEILALDDQPSGLGWLPDGRLLVVAMHSRRILRLDPTGLAVHADLAPIVNADLNDMVVTPAGVAYVGNFGYDVETSDPVTTGLVKITPDGRAEMQPGRLLRPNGCAVTPDGRRLIVAETRVGRLQSFAVGVDGSLSNQRLFGEIPRKAWSDGICLDVDNAVWVCDPVGRRVVRMLDGGAITHTIDTAPLQAIACALGGPEARTLFVSLATIRPFPEMAAEPTSRIEAVRVDVAGAGSP